MIEAHVGLPGSGKTLHATARLIAAKKQGRKALANFHCQSDLWEFGLWHDMTEATNCLAVIDEAHMWFSAREFHKMTQVEMSVFQQHRKEGMDVIWIAQHESRVDVSIRELTAFIWRHQRIGRFVLARRYTPDEPKKVYGRKVVMIRPILFNNYFTEERIGMRDGTGYKFGAGTAYKRSVGPGPALDENLRLRANYFRLETPGAVRYLRVDEPGISEAVAYALMDWRSLRSQVEPGDICRGVYRGADGRFHEIDGDGELVANTTRGDLLDEAVALFNELRKTRLADFGKLTRFPGSVIPNPPSTSLPGGSGGSVKPEAVISRALPKSVWNVFGGQSKNEKSITQADSKGLTDAPEVPKAFRFRGDLDAA